MKNALIVGSLVAALYAPALALADTTVTATAGTGATVSPAGITVIPTLSTQVFQVGASSGYTLSSVVYDGVVQPLGNVSITGVGGDFTGHTIDVGATVTPPVTGGGSMQWCSNPLAPGWNTSLPDGGCGGSEILVPFGGVVYAGNGSGIGLVEICPFNQGCMVSR
jgi:hypothetical protein